jgi:diacylglycerol kinase (ATP)
MDKIGVVVNPYSGGGAAGRIEPWLRLRLGPRLEMVEVGGPVDVAAWARERADAGFERIIVIGGDGTFRSVAAAMIGVETPLGLIPAGTNNNIAGVLGLPSELHEAAEMALQDDAEWVSAGRVGDYVFFEGAGVGLEADLWPLGEAVVRHQFRELLSAPLSLAQDRGVELDIRLDSETITVRAFTLSISNTPMTGAHLKLAPGIDIRDPLLYMTVYHDLGRLDLLLAARGLQQGHQGHGYKAVRYPFMRAHVEATKRLHVHADGTLIGRLPVDIQAIPKAVRIAYPPTPPAAAPCVREHLDNSYQLGEAS